MKRTRINRRKAIAMWLAGYDVFADGKNMTLTAELSKLATLYSFTLKTVFTVTPYIAMIMRDKAWREVAEAHNVRQATLYWHSMEATLNAQNNTTSSEKE